MADVFCDLQLRCKPAPETGQIDKLSFVQFLSLPAIISERIHKMCRISKSNDNITYESFFLLQSQIFCGDDDQR